MFYSRISPYLGKLIMIFYSIIIMINVFHIHHYRYSPDPDPIANHFQSNYPIHLSRALTIDSIKRAAQSKYLPLHLYPVPIWIALAFLQTSSWIRHHFLHLHRLGGRLMLIFSALMTLGIALMQVSYEDIVGKDLDTTSFWGLFTFSSASFLIKIWWIVCMVQLFRYASAKTIQLHKYWSLQFISIGFGTGTLRIGVFLYMLIKYPRSGDRVLSKEEYDHIMDVAMWLGLLINPLLVKVFVTSGIIKSSNETKKKVI